MRVELMIAPRPGEVLRQVLTLPDGLHVAEVLRAADVRQAEWTDAVAAALAGDQATSLWSRRVALDEGVRDGDRLAIARPLLVDPKLARRERFKGQGSKTAGLFSKRRPGAKAGY